MWVGVTHSLCYIKGMSHPMTQFNPADPAYNMTDAWHCIELFMKPHIFKCGYSSTNQLDGSQNPVMWKKSNPARLNFSNQQLLMCLNTAEGCRVSVFWQCWMQFFSTTLKPALQTHPSPNSISYKENFQYTSLLCKAKRGKFCAFFLVLCALFQVDLSCAVLTLGLLGWERQQMGLGQRADASDSKRPGCWVEAVSVRKLLFPREPTNHWRKLKMSPLRNAIKSSKKLQLCRWCAAVWLLGC